jgi:putative tryptophan/tyrosine transport system substrate-binding protein
VRRRDALTVLISSAVLAAMPPFAAAESPRSGVRLGWLSSGRAGSGLEVFKDELRSRGYIEGRHYAMALHLAEGRLDQLDALARDLVGLPVDLIVAAPTTAALAARRATTSIPIVVPIALDAVRAGLVALLAHPGGNVTGLTLMSGDVIGKRLELMRETVPGLRRVGLLVPAGIPDVVAPFIAEFKDAAASLRLDPVIVEVAGADDLDAAFQTLAAAKSEALYVLESQALDVHRDRIFALALAHRLPTISGTKLYIQGGALMSYAPDVAAMYRRAAAMAMRILAGTPPADLPMEQPTTFDLTINLKTAKALGLTIPHAILARADEVIE